jgi:hypothetical protein
MIEIEHTIVEEMFSVRFTPGLYNESVESYEYSCEEAGSNTYTEAR